MSTSRTVEKAVRLAIEIRRMARERFITRWCARNWLDRLALRMDREGEHDAHERISVIYMRT